MSSSPDQISVTGIVPRLRKHTLEKERATIDTGSLWNSTIAIDTINSSQSVIRFEVPELDLVQVGVLNITAKNSTINGLSESSKEQNGIANLLKRFAIS
ncbi:hypothetical protein [Enterococcus faecium]|uniref:hypothetical protein n=1 Tax=Enterococcus faecium TaxID=1352 RepID=UPI001D0E57CD|nr:hypothetical protein [Enterococcus faecium]